MFGAAKEYYNLWDNLNTTKVLAEMHDGPPKCSTVNLRVNVQVSRYIQTCLKAYLSGEAFWYALRRVMPIQKS